MLNDIPTISGLEHIGVPTSDYGAANFIQLYINDGGVQKPFFRVGLMQHQFLLEEFLKEANIERDKCELTGGGIINKLSVGERWTNPITGRSHIRYNNGYVLSEQCGPFQKYPNMNHIDKISQMFDMNITFYEKYNPEMIILKKAEE